MKVYLVEGNTDMEMTPGNFVETSWVYGIFSSKEKADEIASKLKKNVSEHDESEEVTISEMEVDKPTEVYHFMMNN